jgi:PAS domain S-box-containing protein
MNSGLVYASAESGWHSETKYRTLFESIDEGFCVIKMLFDDQGKPVDYRFLEVNPGFERQTGLLGAVGKRIKELAPAHEDHWYKTYGAVALTGESVRFEARAEALKRWYDVYAFRVGDPRQHLVAVLFNDVSERKQIELALQEADQRKNEFIAILAHELRNPLAPMRNALQIMKMARDDPSAVERARMMIERQVDHMVTLVDDLMDVSRISRGQVSIHRRPTDMVLIVHRAIEAAEPLMKQREHTLSVHIPDAAVCVEADPARVTQALANLLINAAKYTDRGGQIAIAVQKIGAEAVITVSDNGIGIPAAMLAEVFDLFTQDASARNLAQGGLGIGLALVKQIVNLHGGDVLAHSEGPGRGSRFTVRLPLSTRAPIAQEETGMEEDTSAAPKHLILVADDNADAAESLSTLLQILGHEVHVVFDGEQAIAVSERLHPKILLLDIGMPGIDGREVARRIRTQAWGANATLVAVTGWGQEGDRASTRDAGFDFHLVKPIELPALEDILKQLPASRR